jgi:hypothetical protein
VNKRAMKAWGPGMGWCFTDVSHYGEWSAQPLVANAMTTLTTMTISEIAPRR